MKGIKLFFVSALIFGAMTGCNEPSLEEEIDDICTCIQSAESQAEYDKCTRKMEEISDKYAFDPEAAEDIKKRLKECASN